MSSTLSIENSEVAAPFRNRWATALLLAVIVFCAIGVRLIGINQPFVEKLGGPEAERAMVAEEINHGSSILYPQINWSGTRGAVGTEFPLLPFAATLLYRIWGVQDWIGRAIPVLMFAISVPFFFLLVIRFSNSSAALFAVIFYAFTPLYIVVSRSFIPDAVSLSLSIIGLYYFLRWADSMEFWRLVLSALLVSTAILMELTYAMILVPIVYISARKFGSAAVKSFGLWCFYIIAVLPSVMWYLGALRAPAASSELSLTGVPILGEQGFGILTAKQFFAIFQRSFWQYLTPLPVVLGVVGFSTFGKGAEYGRSFHFLLLAVSALTLVTGPANNNYHWQQLPFVPIGAAFSGSALESILRRYNISPFSRRSIILACCFIPILCAFSYIALRDDYKGRNQECIEGAKHLDSVAPAAARVLITGGEPSCLYFTRRKGWPIWNPRDDDDGIASLERYRAAGATYLLIDKSHLWWLEYYKQYTEYLRTTYLTSASSKRYVIFDLTNRKQQPAVRF